MCSKREFSLKTCWLLLGWLLAFSYMRLTYGATEYNQYLSHVFKKYGSGDTMTFEGLEHLMYNLGLGGIEFEPQHTIDEHRPPRNLKSTKAHIEHTDEDVKKLSDESAGQAGQQQPQQKLVWDINNSYDVLMKDRSLAAKNGILLEFREMHDPKHRHPREKATNFDASPPVTTSSSSSSVTENGCLSPQDVLRLVVNHDDLHKRKLYKSVTAMGTATGSAKGQSDGVLDHEEQNVGIEEHNTEAEYTDFINNVNLTPLAFMKLCPALLVQIDQHVCARSAPLRHAEDTKEELLNAWIYASCSIFILSACGLLGIALVPLMETIAYKEILKFLVAVAVGTLSGDALMHLLPHALVVQEQEHHDDEDEAMKRTASLLPSGGHHGGHDNTPVWICACAFATAVFMYILEHLLPLLRGRTENGHRHGHSHNHSHCHSKKGNEAAGSASASSHHAHHGTSHTHHSETTNIKIEEKEPTTTTTIAVDSVAAAAVADPKDIKELNVMLNETKLDMKGPRPLTPVAFMVIIGDGLHNLTDGLAIGAAFASDPVTGLATAFAVLCHELPHELGDFALLLQTGVSIRRAVYLNIVSSVLSFLGMAIGLLIAGLHSNMTQWIYAGTAGSFLYIAFADLMPAMNDSDANADADDNLKNLKNVLIQIAGIIVGGIIMIVIAVNEESLEELFK